MLNGTEGRSPKSTDEVLTPEEFYEVSIRPLAHFLKDKGEVTSKMKALKKTTEEVIRIYLANCRNKKQQQLNYALYIAHSYGDPTYPLDNRDNPQKTNPNAILTFCCVRELLQRVNPDMVICVARSGLGLGGIAKYLGYQPYILEAHTQTWGYHHPYEGDLQKHEYPLNIIFVDGSVHEYTGEVVEITPITKFRQKVMVLDDTSQIGATPLAVDTYLKERGVIERYYGIPNCMNYPVLKKVLPNLEVPNIHGMMEYNIKTVQEMRGITKEGLKALDIEYVVK